jgi:hypothetical protein
VRLPPNHAAAAARGPTLQDRKKPATGVRDKRGHGFGYGIASPGDKVIKWRKQFCSDGEALKQAAEREPRDLAKTPPGVFKGA